MLLQHHTVEQIELLKSFIASQLLITTHYEQEIGSSLSYYASVMKKVEYLSDNFTFENNIKNAKRAGEENPLQLLLNQPRINLRQVFKLFQCGETKDAKNRDGDTLLHIAAKNKWPDEAIELLLDAGLDPNIRDQDGNTVLHILATQRKHELIETMIKKYHANPVMLDKNNQTAEQVLAHASHWWTRIIHSLGFEKNPPALTTPSTAKEAQEKQEKTATTPPPSFSSYPDISAMKAEAQAQYASAKQDESPYAKLPGFFGYVGSFLYKLDNADTSNIQPLRSTGNGMLVISSSLPTLSANSSLVE